MLKRLVNLINLTPHDITFFLGEDEFNIPPSGVIARVVEKREEASPLAIHYPENQEVERTWDSSEQILYLLKKTFGETTGLPAEVKPDTYYIVSALVANANPGRKDLVCPETKKIEGRIICTGLIQNCAE